MVPVSVSRACLGLLLCLALTPVVAQDNAPLTLREAIERTLARNPQLQSFAFRLQAQRARSEIAGLRPAPELRMEVENFAGTGQASGIDLAEATLAISQIIELGQKRELRLQAANAATDVLDQERSAAQLDVVADVARRFIHVASDQAQLELAGRATELARRTLDAANRRVESARAPDAELNRARVTLARAQIEEEHAEHELAASRRKLAAMWGETEERFSAVQADLYRMPELPRFESIAAQVTSTPEFRRFTSEARLRDVEVRLAEARSRADLMVSAGVRRLQNTDDQAFVLGVNVPLFTGARARGHVAEARAQRAQTDADQEAWRVRVLAQLFEVYQELKHAITEADTLRQTVAPEMEAALKATEYAFDRGRYSYLEWMEAQRELIAVQRSLIEASANAHTFQIEIERLTGSELPAAR